jgi:hypothetical protein
MWGGGEVKKLLLKRFALAVEIRLRIWLENWILGPLDRWLSKTVKPRPKLNDRQVSLLKALADAETCPTCGGKRKFNIDGIALTAVCQNGCEPQILRRYK